LVHNPGNLSLSNFGGTSAPRKLNRDGMLESIVTFKRFSLSSDNARPGRRIQPGSEWPPPEKVT